jgi:hypothetical protein
MVLGIASIHGRIGFSVSPITLLYLTLVLSLHKQGKIQNFPLTGRWQGFKNAYNFADHSTTSECPGSGFFPLEWMIRSVFNCPLRSKARSLVETEYEQIHLGDLMTAISPSMLTICTPSRFECPHCTLSD